MRESLLSINARAANNRDPSDVSSRLGQCTRLTHWECSCAGRVNGERARRIDARALLQQEALGDRLKLECLRRGCKVRGGRNFGESGRVLQQIEGRRDPMRLGVNR